MENKLINIARIQPNTVKKLQGKPREKKGQFLVFFQGIESDTKAVEDSNKSRRVIYWVNRNCKGFERRR